MLNWIKSTKLQLLHLDKAVKTTLFLAYSRQSPTSLIKICIGMRSVQMHFVNFMNLEYLLPCSTRQHTVFINQFMFCYSDLTINLADGKLKGHRFVLAARSDEWGVEDLSTVSELDLSGILNRFPLSRQARKQ